MSETRQTTVMSSPVGLIEIAHCGNRLFEIYIRPEIRTVNSSGSDDVIEQFNAYFSDPGYRFDFILDAEGTSYQHKIWSTLQKIPVSSISTYGQLATELKSGARAVAQACRRNPLPLVVPCHRVVSARGIGGYMGETTGPAMSIKEWLLAHERR